MRNRCRRRRPQRGGALLAVLWLTAALSAIVFALALTVRAEFERAATAMDGTRAYFLAQGAIERFMVHLLWGERIGMFKPGQQNLRFDFPAGSVDLEIVGESGKLNVYSAPPPALVRLFVSLGVDEARASAITGGIVALRRRDGGISPAGSSFSYSWPSFLQLEDLLRVKGMKSDIYYGWWDRDPEGRLMQRGGLARYLTVVDEFGLNVNYASPEVLRAAGVPEGLVAALLEARRQEPIDGSRMTAISSVTLPGGLTLSGGGSSAYTVRATARLKDRDARRTVTALVRQGRNRQEPNLAVARWYPTSN